MSDPKRDAENDELRYQDPGLEYLDESEVNDEDLIRYMRAVI